MTGPRRAEEASDPTKIANRASSVARLFVDRVAATPQAEAFRYPLDDGWSSVTWQQVDDRVRLISAGLIALGIAPEDRVALASSTRYEWVLVDLAVMCAGAATTTVYPTTNAHDVAFIVADSGSRIVVAEDKTQVDKLIARRAELPDVHKVVRFDGEGDGDWVLTLDELEALGRRLLAETPDVVDDRINSVRPEQLASIIYTSGTTGRPKGVRLTHGAWTYTAAAIDALQILGPDDLNFLWLPLAHAFGKVMLALPLTIGFPTAIDGRVDKIVENLAVVRPTIMGAAPAHLREGPCSRRGHDRRGGRCQEANLRLGDRGGPQGFPGQAGRREAVAATVAGIQGRRPAGVFHDPRAIRRSPPVLRLRGRGPESATSPSGSTRWESSCSRATD